MHPTIGRDCDRRLFGRGHIGPPGPGRYTHQTREFQHTIGRPPWIAAYHQQARLSVDGGCHVLEGFPFSDNVLATYFLLFQQVTKIRFLVGHANENGATIYGRPLLEGPITNLAGILEQHIDGCLHYLVFTLVNHGRRAVFNQQIEAGQCIDRL